jgi:cytochrome P450
VLTHSHDLLALPYLDKVTREILRMDSPVPGAQRIAARDVVLPLAMPIRGRDGTMMDSVQLRKGDQLVASMFELNRSHELWGADAHEFIPERWDKEHPSALKVPGVWGNIMAFAGGPHNCLWVEKENANGVWLTYLAAGTASRSP